MRDNSIFLTLISKLTKETESLLGQMRLKSEVNALGFSPNNSLMCVSFSNKVRFYERPDSSSKGVQLEPFLQVRQFNTESALKVDSLTVTHDSRFLFYSTDDYVVRSAGILGGPFKRFQLRGHKETVLEIITYFEFKPIVVTVDKAGLLLVWEMVKDEDEESEISDSEESEAEEISENDGVVKPEKRKQIVGVSTSGNKIGRQSAIETERIQIHKFKKLSEVSELERVYFGSRFILKTKNLVFQEGTQIDSMSS